MRTKLLVIAALFISYSIFAQSPEKMSYQAVVRNSSNALVVLNPVGMQISILQGSVGGTAVYVETHATNTNANGLVTVEIGGGTVVSGTIAGIDWSAGPYFIKTETDPTGGTAYSITGTSQLLSVPYALYSKSAGNVANDMVNDADSVVGNEYNTTVVLNGTNLETTDGGGTITTDLSSLVNDADADPANELQTLSIEADTITIANGNSIVLPSTASDNDWLVNGNNMTAQPTGNVAIGVTVLPTEKLTVGDTGLFRISVGHAGDFNEVESGRLVFTEDVNFNGTCGFEFHLDGAANTLSLESGCTAITDTSIVFTRTGEVRIPERVKIGENSNPACDVHVKQAGTGTSPGSSGLRLEDGTATDYNQIWTDGSNLNFSLNSTRISFISNTGAYTQVSDSRLKNSITPMDSVLSDVMKLKPVEFFYNHSDSKVKSKGFIAQDVQEVFPELVNKSEDTDMLAVQYVEFGVVAVKAIQEQQVQIEKQAAQISAQQAEINAMKAAIEELKGIVKKEVAQAPASTNQEAVPVIKKNAYENDADQ